MRRLTLADRFWSKVDLHGPASSSAPELGPCWLWIARVDRDGYGHINIGAGQNYLAHRWAYEALIGPIPDGLDIDHLCRVRRCQNPWHMEPVPRRVNTLRGFGPAAINARKTHCQRGHEYTEQNTYVRRGRDFTGRGCRRCNLLAVSAYKARKRSAA